MLNTFFKHLKSKIIIMKKIFILFLFFYTLLYSSSSNKIYKVVLHKDWKPYYFINENGNPDGYAVELFNAVAQKSNISFEYIVVNNWKEVNNLIEEGNIDIVPNYGITAHRSDLLVFTQPTDTFSINLFKRISSSKLLSHNDMKSSNVGVVEGNACNKLLTNSISPNITKYEQFTIGVNSLLSGDIDVFCYPKPLLDFKLKELNLEDKIVSFEVPIDEIKRGIAISKNNFELLPLFDEAISALKISGEHKEIYSNWFTQEKFIEFTKNQLIIIGCFTLVVFILLFFFLFYYSNKKKWILTNNDLKHEIDIKTKELQKLSTTDTLTKIYNRTKLDEILTRKLINSKRIKNKFNVIMIDIDFFKEVNDNYGHLVGDQVLIEFTEIINQNIRESDYFGRWGGEEFLLISICTSENGDLIWLNRIKDAIEKHTFAEGIKRTASFGVTRHIEDDTISTMIKRADDALYEAKNGGRNSICINNK